MHMIRQKPAVKAQSPEGLLHLVQTDTSEKTANREAVLPDWLGGSWNRALPQTERQAPWLEVIPRAEPGIPAEAQTLFVAQRETSRQVQYWETAVFYALGISGAAGVAIAFWALTHIAQ